MRRKTQPNKFDDPFVMGVYRNAYKDRYMAFRKIIAGSDAYNNTETIKAVSAVMRTSAMEKELIKKLRDEIQCIKRTKRSRECRRFDAPLSFTRFNNPSQIYRMLLKAKDKDARLKLLIRLIDIDGYTPVQDFIELDKRRFVTTHNFAVSNRWGIRTRHSCRLIIVKPSGIANEYITQTTYKAIEVRSKKSIKEVDAYLEKYFKRKAEKEAKREERTQAVFNNA